MRLAILFFLLGVCVFAESSRELLLLHQKYPNDKRVLHFLAKAYLIEGDGARALHYFLKAGVQQDPYPGTWAGVARTYFALSQPYRSYEICKLKPTGACEDFLAEMSQAIREEMDVYEFRYRFEHKDQLSMDDAYSLLERYPQHSDLLETMFRFFASKNQQEIAYDWGILAGMKTKRKVRFQLLARRYLEKLRKLRRDKGSRDQEFFLTYYLSKFDPELFERREEDSLKDTISFFETLVESQSGGATFENLYRLAYLHSLAGKAQKAREALFEALERAPHALFVTLAERMIDYWRELGKQEVEIQMEDLAKVQGGKAFYEKRKEQLFKVEEKVEEKSLEKDEYGYLLPQDMKDMDRLFSKINGFMILNYCDLKRSDCKKLIESTHKDEELRDILLNFTNVRVDPRSSLASGVGRQFPVRQIPQIYILNSNRSVVSQLNGIREPALLKQEILRVSSQ